MIPTIKRRLASLIYEGLLLLALLLIASFPFAGMGEVARQGAMRIVLQIYLLLVLGAYFLWFWRNGGQTLPMKTWRIKLVTIDDKPITWGRGIGRFVLAALAYLPTCIALLILFFFNSRIEWTISIWLFLPMVATVLWAKFDAHQQFLHDYLAKTKLVMVA